MGDAVLVQDVTHEELAKSARDAEHLAIMTGLGVKAGIIAPLRARGRTLGLVWLYTCDGLRPAYGERELALARELTTRIALALDNTRLYGDAQQAIQLRDEFLSIASHELKTPLTPLKLQIGRLRREPLGESAKEKLDAANRQIDRLTRLVNQLLDVSRITAGRLSLEIESVDLGRVVEEVTLELEQDRLRSGSELRLDLAPQVIGAWDPLRVAQVVSNLFSNAIKYGGGKPIDVVLTADAHVARLSIHDRGIGIESDDQARVFDRFERAVSVRHYGGFGLGLWIARQVVEASHGKISVKSEPGEGSTFVVELPLDAPT
jgi:signal transduction histidine kinase